MDMKSSLEVAKAYGNGDMGAYRAALEFIIDNRGELKTRVYIVLPGGLGGNSDSVWDKVRAGSVERCSCGNERVINPLVARETFENGVAVVVTPGAPAYIRPLGGDRESCFMKVEIVESALTWVKEPFAPFILSMDLFSRQGYKLDQLAPVVNGKSDVDLPVMWQGKDPKIALFKITNVDESNVSITIVLDKDIEVFDPDEEKPRHETPAAG